jgi:hypothetical protein
MSREEELRRRILTFFSEVRFVGDMSTDEEFSGYSFAELQKMRLALQRAGLLKKWGNTRDTRYLITNAGKRYLEGTQT